MGRVQRDAMDGRRCRLHECRGSQPRGALCLKPHRGTRGLACTSGRNGRWKPLPFHTAKGLVCVKVRRVTVPKTSASRDINEVDVPSILKVTATRREPSTTKVPSRRANRSARDVKLGPRLHTILPAWHITQVGMSQATARLERCPRNTLAVHVCSRFGGASSSLKCGQQHHDTTSPCTGPAQYVERSIKQTPQ